MFCAKAELEQLFNFVDLFFYVKKHRQYGCITVFPILIPHQNMSFKLNLFPPNN